LQASRSANINYSSAKVILRIYRKFGRSEKKKTRDRKILNEIKDKYHSKEIIINEAPVAKLIPKNEK